MKRSELFFSFLLIPVDAIMVIASFLIAYYLRKYQGEIIWFWPISEYLKFIIAILPFWIIIFALQGLYDIKKNQQGVTEFARVFLGASSGIMLIVAWIFLSRTYFFSRLIIVYAWLIAIFMIFIGRIFVTLLKQYLYKYQIGVHRLILVGKNNISYDILKEVQNNRSLGYKFIGFISLPDDKNYQKNENNKVLGPVSQLESIVNEHPADDVFLTSSALSEGRTLKIIQYCQDNDINFKQTPNLFKVRTTNVELSTIAGIPVVEFRRTPLDGWGKIMKRTMDLILSLMALIILSPILLVVAICVKMDSPGPVFYRNARVGENNKKFILYKFRSMKIESCTGDGYGGKDAENYENKLILEKNHRKGPVYKVMADPRRTKFGRFIERTSLDELPQFYNSLVGQISLVGPRPHQPREVSSYEQWHKKVLRIKPGITGMAQISGRSDLDFDEEAQLDIYYIENWNLWMDIKILFKTPGALFRSRKYS